jgi:hypothetical protein
MHGPTNVKFELEGVNLKRKRYVQALNIICIEKSNPLQVLKLELFISKVICKLYTLAYYIRVDGKEFAPT